MSSPRPRIRWLTNAFLNVTDPEGNQKETLFKSGSYTAVTSIVRYPDGYCNIYIDDYEGENPYTIEGLKFDLKHGFELHGKLEIEDAEHVEKKTIKKDLEDAPADNSKEQKTTKKKPPRRWMSGW